MKFAGASTVDYNEATAHSTRWDPVYRASEEKFPPNLSVKELHFFLKQKCVCF